jgi:hypothetical protein
MRFSVHIQITRGYTPEVATFAASKHSRAQRGLKKKGADRFLCGIEKNFVCKFMIKPFHTISVADPRVFVIKDACIKKILLLSAVDISHVSSFL